MCNGMGEKDVYERPRAALRCSGIKEKSEASNGMELELDWG